MLVEGLLDLKPRFHVIFFVNLIFGSFAFCSAKYLTPCANHILPFNAFRNEPQSAFLRPVHRSASAVLHLRNTKKTGDSITAPAHILQTSTDAGAYRCRGGRIRRTFRIARSLCFLRSARLFFSFAVRSAAAGLLPSAAVRIPVSRHPCCSVSFVLHICDPISFLPAFAGTLSV